MNEEEKLTQLLNKFNNGLELYNNNVTFNYFINAIIRNQMDIYTAFEKSIQMINTQTKLITEYELKNRDKR
jgi:hypothetical protein